MERSVVKTYLAITEGAPRPVSGKVEGNIGRSRSDRKLHAMIKTGGRHSLTLYRTLENYGSLALVECDLKTGRTHQARVHMTHLGAPILCDNDYGKRDIFTQGDLERALEIFRLGAAGTKHPTGATILSRQALHAWRLAFRHPANNQPLEFEAPLPADMLAVLAPLRSAMQAMQS